MSAERSPLTRWERRMLARSGGRRSAKRIQVTLPRRTVEVLRSIMSFAGLIRRTTGS